MGKAWVKGRKGDAYYRAAKREGFRSRAAFKLLQIDERFRVFYEGDAVVDLGAAPGGWSQVAKGLVGEKGTVVAVDRVSMAPLEGVVFVRGDVGDPETLRAVRSHLPEGAHVVVSDMAPKLSGQKSLDHARSVDLVVAAFDLARRVMRPGGVFVAKAFKGDLYPDLIRRLRRAFRTVKDYTPPASSRGSAETYVVAKGFLGRRP
jgi:23S rRNA (uridine2552-2'-O)-methyltransferase